MYIKQFDELFNNLLDELYKRLISKNELKFISKIINFANEYESILKFINSIISNISSKDLALNDKNLSEMLKNILSKYVALYVFLYIGYNSRENIDLFKDSVIEISKKYEDDKNKIIEINNFFTSENNSIIFVLTDLIIRTFDKSKLIPLDALKSMTVHDNAKKIISSITENEWNNISDTTTVKKQLHNIIKFVVTKQFSLVDRQNIAKTMEIEGTDSEETTYIEIVVPFETTIDLAEIEAMFTKEEVTKGIAKHVYTLLTKNEHPKKILSVNEKILELINCNILIPITEEFLLYNKTNEFYGKKISSADKKSGINYILEKIESVENYYSSGEIKPKSSTENSNLYSPMANRFVVTCNEFEDNKIIMSHTRSVIGSSERFEQYNKFIHYKNYPYINFKNFKKYGIPITFNNTKNVIRSISFETTGKNKQALFDPVQTRVGSDEQQVNVIGFLLNTTPNSLNCSFVKQLKLVKDGYGEFIEYLSDSINNNKTNMIGWMFDLEKDIAGKISYERVDTNAQIEQCQILCSKLYDNFIRIICDKITNILNKFKEISFYDAQRIVQNVMRKTLNIQETTNEFIEIEKCIYSKLYEKYVPKYDVNEDIVYGITDIDTIKLPEPKKYQKLPILNIHITDNSQTKKIISETSINGNLICQHFVDWSNVIIKKKTDESKYIEDLREFSQTFVIENTEHEYVCKSCGAVINIQKYIADGTYDNVTQKFVAFSIPIDVPLEDFPEYKKYSLTIRNIDRLIDKIGSIVNLPYLVGSALTQKIKRSSMVKETIDLLLVNNALLDKNRREHIEKIVPQYGITRDLSNLFVFTLENSIFQTLSKEKEKDYHKDSKHNNVVAYILFLIIIELEESHISFISGDKVCNFSLFDKFKSKIFDKLRLKINDHNDVADILNYPVLCYILYVMTCSLSKYTIWRHKTDEDITVQYKKKIDPMKQIIMIQTMVDLINSILTFAERNKNKPIYEIVYTKFYQRLNSLFNNDQIIKKLKDENIKNLTQFTKAVPVEVAKNLPLQKDFAYSGFDKTIYLSEYDIPKYYAKQNKYSIVDVRNNNLINCENGKLHKWIPFGLTMKCKRCNKILSELKYDEKLTKTIKENIYVRYLEKLCNKYCFSGELHAYETVKKDKSNDLIDKCRKCNYVLNTYLPINEMKELSAIVMNPKILSVDEEQKEHHAKYVQSIINILKSEYANSKESRSDYYKFISNFVSFIQSNIGDIIRIDNNTYYLKENVYIINHNHLGFPIEPPLTVKESEKIISFKGNHNFFKCDVLIYAADKSPKVEIFYDAHTYILLGYKEYNKEFVKIDNSRNRLKIEYSIENKIKYFGSKLVNIPIDNKNIVDLISEISRDRIENISTAIYKLIVYVNVIKNKLKPVISTEDEERTTLFDLDKYFKKLSGLITNEQSSKTKFYKRWDLIVKNIHYNEPNKINEKVLSQKSGYISLDEIYDYDYSGNLILYYFISEITKLINWNKNKYVRQNLIQFIVEFINGMFKEFNVESWAYNSEIQIFKHVLSSSEYFKEIENIVDEYTSGIYGEYKDPDEEKPKEQLEEEEDAREEAESIDVDGDIDAEDEYDNAYNEREIGRVLPLKWEQLIDDPFENY